MLKIIPDYHKLTISEALAILHRKPDLNRQIDNFVNPLKLFSRITHITNIITDPLQNTNINYNYTNLATSATPQARTSLTPHRYPITQPIIQYKLTFHPPNYSILSKQSIFPYIIHMF